MRWTAVILAGWSVFAGVVLIQKALPASFWMDVRHISVIYDGSPDGCFPMEVDRDIHREFFAEWTVTIMKQNDRGTYFTYRTFPKPVPGANDYRPENELPDNLNLCWWADRPSIMFLPGTYRVHTLWTLRVNGGDRTIRRKSSAFTVPPAD